MSPESDSDIEKVNQLVPSSDLTELGEQILLVVPARPEMWAVVRMTASALATRLDFSFESVEDLRLAVTELCGSCATGALVGATCECRFAISEDQFAMHCQVSEVVETEPLEEEHRLMSTLELSKQILQATVDSYVIDPVKEGVCHGYLCKDRDSVALK